MTEYEPSISVVYASSGYVNIFYTQRIFINVGLSPEGARNELCNVQIIYKSVLFTGICNVINVF